MNQGGVGLRSIGGAADTNRVAIVAQLHGILDPDVLGRERYIAEQQYLRLLAGTIAGALKAGGLQVVVLCGGSTSPERKGLTEAQSVMDYLQDQVTEASSRLLCVHRSCEYYQQPQGVELTDRLGLALHLLREKHVYVDHVKIVVASDEMEVACKSEHALRGLVPANTSISFAALQRRDLQLCR